MMRHGLKQKGFTLLEVMVASVIGVFIAMVAVGTLHSVIRAKELVNDNTAAADELRFAANMIRNDLANLYRDKDRNSVRLVGTLEETKGGLITSLTMRVVSSVNARFSEPEGDVYEVQYYLQKNEERAVLMRRVCPIVGIEDGSETLGGILTPIAENIMAFDVQYYNDTEWLMEWPVEQTELPKLVEITLTASASRDVSEKDVINKSFVVHFPRLPQMTQEQSSESSEGTPNR